MKSKIIFAILSIFLIGGSATAITPDDIQYLQEKRDLTNDVQVWIHAEQNIDMRIAKDDLRQLSMQYTNHAISIDPSSGFYTQKTLGELRTKMSYYATRVGYDIPTFRIG